VRFWGVHEGYYEGVQRRIDMFRFACESRSVEYVDVDSLSWDYSKIPVLTRSDLLYNISRGSQTLLSLLLNPKVTTPYRINPVVELVTSTTTWSIIHSRHGLRAPRTIFSLSADRRLLDEYVTFLGGFPIILKAVIGSRGIGTIKVEGWHSLLSTADYLVSTQSAFIMRQYIPAIHGVRAIVVGEEVASSSRFSFQENDFRNAPILSATVYSPCSLTLEDVSLCVSAARLANLEVGGVDLLYDREGAAYLLEINYPTGFQSVLPGGQEIVDKILDHLIKKAVNEQSSL
jgi:RimK-like ATP-grasp domain